MPKGGIMEVGVKRVVITGGTGFIGSWLVKELTENQIEVILLVRKETIRQEKELEGIKRISYASEAFASLEKQECGEIDVFFHLAWGGVSTELKNDCELQLENIRFSLKMLELAKRIGAKKFVATGTVAEYAFCESIMDVNARQTPNDMYGAAKTAAHYMLGTRARMLEMPFIWAVLPSTYGEGRRDNNIITYTINSLLRRERPQYGFLEQMWDFLYVSEVARALRLIGEKGVSERTYAIGSGVFKPLKEYIIEIRDIIDPKLELGIGDIPSNSDKAFSSCVSIYDLIKDTGFMPQIDFKTGITRTIAYYRGLMKAEDNSNENNA